MKTYLCVSKTQKEWDYCHANWLLIEAETREKARRAYVMMDGDTNYIDVEAKVCTDSQMGAKLEGQGHPLAVARGL